MWLIPISFFDFYMFEMASRKISTLTFTGTKITEKIFWVGRDLWRSSQSLKWMPHTGIESWCYQPCALSSWATLSWRWPVCSSDLSKIIEYNLAMPVASFLRSHECILLGPVDSVCVSVPWHDHLPLRLNFPCNRIPYCSQGAETVKGKF